MLGLHYFACDGCDTVWADPEPSGRCIACGTDAVTDITDQLGDPSYFVGE